MERGGSGTCCGAGGVGNGITNAGVRSGIGNLIMEDTTDFRFSNLFKNPKNPITWYIPKVLKEVLPDSQNNILGSTVDIRGQKVTEVNDRLNTYGLLDFLNNKNPISFPLSPDKNNVRALQRQPLRIGYKSLQDIQTMKLLKRNGADNTTLLCT